MRIFRKALKLKLFPFPFISHHRLTPYILLLHFTLNSLAGIPFLARPHAPLVRNGDARFLS